MKIYIVMGTTGEYSDRGEWPVCAYSSLEKAKEHVTNATKRANELYAECENSDDAYDTRYALIEAKANQYDQYMKMDYNGTTYFLYETTLYNEV